MLVYVRFAPKSGHHSWPLRQSALCQKRTNAPQQKAMLFDHLVGAGEQHRRHGKRDSWNGTY